MSMKENYELFLEGKKVFGQKHLSKYYMNQESRYVKPFQMYGNLYYVGDSWVCAHLVDTGSGLILFDGGNCGATAMLIQSIWEMGFNPADVKWLILSHGHVDHIGAANFFKRMFGTKIYLGEPDARMYRENPEISMIQNNPDITETLPEIDVEIHDGDVIKFGNTEILFYLVPGHTAGCIACFFPVTDGKETKRAGYYGGFGFNTLQKEYLTEIGDTALETRNIYLSSLKKVRDEKVDIFMGNHTVNNDLLNKREYMKKHPEENPFVNDSQWRDYMDMRQEAVLEMIKNS